MREDDSGESLISLLQDREAGISPAESDRGLENCFWSLPIFKKVDG